MGMGGKVQPVAEQVGLSHFFAVFDGHGGGQVADLVARHMPDLVGAQVAAEKEPIAALQEAFSRAEEELRSVV